MTGTPYGYRLAPGSLAPGRAWVERLIARWT